MQYSTWEPWWSNNRKEKQRLHRQESTPAIQKLISRRTKKLWHWWAVHPEEYAGELVIELPEREGRRSRGWSAALAGREDGQWYLLYAIWRDHQPPLNPIQFWQCSEFAQPEEQYDFIPIEGQVDERCWAELVDESADARLRYSAYEQQQLLAAATTRKRSAASVPDATERESNRTDSVRHHLNSGS